MIERLNFIDDLLDQAELGGGAYHHERLAKRGKMPIRQRIMNVLDDDSPFLEISPLAPIAGLMIEKYLSNQISNPELENFILSGNLISKDDEKQ